jgi:leader peptidase (prepilin peptidase) / N-methyltransferase
MLAMTTLGLAVNVEAVMAAFGCVLAGLLLALAVSDLKSLVLPDRLNLMLAVTGLGQSLVLGLPGFADASLGTILGVGILGLIAACFRRLRGIDGLAIGDLKLISAAGLWVGWQGVPLLLSVASTTALAFVAIRAALQRRLDRMALLPFGPFLAIGTFVSWLVTVLV